MDQYVDRDGLTQLPEPRRRGRDDASAPRAARPKASLVARVHTALLRILVGQIIHRGTLTVATPDGAAHVFGSGTPAVRIRITAWSTIRRLVTDPDLALGEAYMDGTLVCETGDIADLLDLCMSNLGCGPIPGPQKWRTKMRYWGRRLTQRNTPVIARANVAHHYDLSDTLYALFLEQGRQYSCAYYRDASDGLEQAQAQKRRHLAAKLLLRPGQRILDIGSGWGGLAIYLAQTEQVDVTGLTLSVEQHRYAQQWTAEAGLADRVRFELRDYRQGDERYDRIVSVGMFEHVGSGDYRAFFGKIRDLLTDDGVALIHTIGRVDGPGVTSAWIQKYIFPGGYVPALSEVLPAIEQAGLYVTDIEVLRLHYARTLKAWRERFAANRAQVAALYDERFCRMWEFYLAASEATFRHGGEVNFQIQLAKRIDAVPLTRDYIADAERSLAAPPLSGRPAA